MRRLAAHLAFDDYIKLTRRFNFLVALGLPGSDTKAFAEYIQFQCNCSLFGDGMHANTICCAVRISKRPQGVSYPSLR